MQYITQLRHATLPFLIALMSTLCSGEVLAQTAATPASAPYTVNPNDPRLPLVDRLLELWHVEDVAVMMVQRPAVNALEQSRVVLQGRVAPAKQQRTLQDISTDVQKYVNDATPIAKASAHKVVKESLTPLLLQNFDELELKQIIALLESPVKKKFESVVPSLEKTLGDRVAADCAAQINPMMQTMTQAVGLKLRAASASPD